MVDDTRKAIRALEAAAAALDAVNEHHKASRCRQMATTLKPVDKQRQHAIDRRDEIAAIEDGWRKNPEAMRYARLHAFTLTVSDRLPLGDVAHQLGLSTRLVQQLAIEHAREALLMEVPRWWGMRMLREAVRERDEHIAKAAPSAGSPDPHRQHADDDGPDTIEG